MFKSLQQFFQTSATTQQDNHNRLNLAACTLLFEIINADFTVDASEETRLKTIAQELFSLDEQAIDDLIDLARNEAKRSVDLYQFTRLINQHYSRQEKCQLLIALWQIALADKVLDKYEEASIRKINDLLFLDHSDFIRAKQTALSKAK